MRAKPTLAFPARCGAEVDPPSRMGKGAPWYRWLSRRPCLCWLDRMVTAPPNPAARGLDPLATPTPAHRPDAATTTAHEHPTMIRGSKYQLQ